MRTLYPGEISWLCTDISADAMILRSKVESFAEFFQDLPPSEEQLWEPGKIGDIYLWCIGKGLHPIYYEDEEIELFPPPGGTVVLEDDYIIHKIEPHGGIVKGLDPSFNFDFIDVFFLSRVKWRLLIGKPEGSYTPSPIELEEGLEAIKYAPPGAYWDGKTEQAGPIATDLRHNYPEGLLWEIDIHQGAIGLFADQEDVLFTGDLELYRFLYHSPFYLLSYELFEHDLFPFTVTKANGHIVQAGDTPLERRDSRAEMYALLHVHPPVGEYIVEEPIHRIGWYGKIIEEMTFGVSETIKQIYLLNYYYLLNGASIPNDCTYFFPPYFGRGGGLLPLVGLGIILGKFLLGKDQ